MILCRKGPAGEQERVARRAKTSTSDEDGLEGSQGQPKGQAEENIVDVMGKKIEPWEARDTSE